MILGSGQIQRQLIFGMVVNSTLPLATENEHGMRLPLRAPGVLQTGWFGDEDPYAVSVDSSGDDEIGLSSCHVALLQQHWSIASCLMLHLCLGVRA
jgi:hypothetical protein